MCIVSKPHIPDPAKDTTGQSAEKPLPILRNPILDGMLGNIAALRAGTSGFRIDLINPLLIPNGPRSSTGGSFGGSSSGGSSSSSGGSSSGGSTSSSSSDGGGGTSFRSTGGTVQRF